MDTFFKYLKQGLVATIFVLFTFTFTYVPLPHQNNVQTAHAGALGGGATEFTQLPQFLSDLLGNIADLTRNALSVAGNAISSLGWNKEWVLDGIAWTIAKQIISNMIQDLISWINSGFKGRPMFVQDIEGFLKETADQVAGEYIQELGGLGSFLCSPFRLNIQIALSQHYARVRDNRDADTCTLTGIIDNIEGFLDGAQGSFSKGGWEDWFNVVSRPEVYTPYGAMLSAQATFNARIINAKGEEISLLNYGSGFLSNKSCQTVDGPSGTKEECDVTTPGKIVQEALSFNIDSERQSLVAADEVNEMFAALIGALGNKLIGSASGLLGL